MSVFALVVLPAVRRWRWRWYRLLCVFGRHRPVRHATALTVGDTFALGLTAFTIAESEWRCAACHRKVAEPR